MNILRLKKEIQKLKKELAELTLNRNSITYTLGDRRDEEQMKADIDSKTFELQFGIQIYTLIGTALLVASSIGFSFWGNYLEIKDFTLRMRPYVVMTNITPHPGSMYDLVFKNVGTLPAKVSTSIVCNRDGLQTPFPEPVSKSILGKDEVLYRDLNFADYESCKFSINYTTAMYGFSQENFESTYDLAREDYKVFTRDSFMK